VNDGVAPVKSPIGWMWSLWWSRICQVIALPGSTPSCGSVPAPLSTIGWPATKVDRSAGETICATGASLPAVIVTDA
jgi:hypothetical protein